MSNILREVFEIGSLVVLDKGKHNESLVEVVYQTPKNLITRVKESGADYRSCFDVMTYRLTKNEIK